MSRYAATDESGRPIVAELGRAETPAEESHRKASSRAERSRNQTPLAFVGAILASLAIVAVLVAVVVRPDPPEDFLLVDYARVASEAQPAMDGELVVPVLPDGWRANRAEIDTGTSDGVDAWRIGFLTPGGQYIGFSQGLDPNPSWTAEELDGSRSTGTALFGDREWTVYDQRDADDPGNLAYALVTEADGTTIVLAGTGLCELFGQELKGQSFVHLFKLVAVVYLLQPS